MCEREREGREEETERVGTVYLCVCVCSVPNPPDSMRLAVLTVSPNRQ